jgi:hypothetical protein
MNKGMMMTTTNHHQNTIDILAKYISTLAVRHADMLAKSDASFDDTVQLDKLLLSACSTMIKATSPIEKIKATTTQPTPIDPRSLLHPDALAVEARLAKNPDVLDNGFLIPMQPTTFVKEVKGKDALPTFCRASAAQTQSACLPGASLLPAESGGALHADLASGRAECGIKRSGSGQDQTPADYSTTAPLKISRRQRRLARLAAGAGSQHAHSSRQLQRSLEHQPEHAMPASTERPVVSELLPAGPISADADACA